MPLVRISDGQPILTPAEQARLDAASKAHRTGHGGGPKTPEGKAKSSRNALKHGLSAQKHTVLDIEDKAEFQALLDSAIDEFRPHSLATVQVIEKLTHLDWTLHRLRALETAYLNFLVRETEAEAGNPFLEMNPLLEAAAATGDDPMAHLVQAWIKAAKDGNPLELLRRYSGSLQTQYNATLKNYLTLEDRKFKRSHIRDLDPDYLPPYKKPAFPEAAPPVTVPENTAVIEPEPVQNQTFAAPANPPVQNELARPCLILLKPPTTPRNT